MNSFKKFSTSFEKFAAFITKIAGSSTSFLVAFSIILIWGITGPFFHFSDTWQLVINTSTTIITFQMVFIIPPTQNKDSLALQIKLNELIACEEKASNRLIDVEDLTQDELEMIKTFYIKLAHLAKKENDLHSSHSLDDAANLHKEKMNHHKAKQASHTKK